MNRSVLIFTLVLSALTSVVCGLAPALHSSRRDLATSMREVSRSFSSVRARHGCASRSWSRKSRCR